ncbi:hypothetical protein [Robbsia andropogonis]|uniref:hypothetical protein n=1 Tax=Robbsia andropogonis TaxID=28092 RepID=UPI0012F92B42|nr:hypothetical protein [Robbsia andropogonis]
MYFFRKFDLIFVGAALIFFTSTCSAKDGLLLGKDFCIDGCEYYKFLGKKIRVPNNGVFGWIQWVNNDQKNKEIASLTLTETFLQEKDIPNFDKETPRTPGNLFDGYVFFSINAADRNKPDQNFESTVYTICPEPRRVASEQRHSGLTEIKCNFGRPPVHVATNQTIVFRINQSEDFIFCSKKKVNDKDVVPYSFKPVDVRELIRCTQIISNAEIGSKIRITYNAEYFPDWLYFSNRAVSIVHELIAK